MSQRFGGKLGRNGFKLKKLQKIDFARSFALSYLEICIEYLSLDPVVEIIKIPLLLHLSPPPAHVVGRPPAL